MDRNPILTDARQARARRRLGPDAACVLCGLSNLEALTPAAKSLLEDHHVVGRAHDATLTVPLCLNCHRIATEGLRQADVSMRPAATLLDRLVAILRSLADFFRLLSERCSRWSDALAVFLKVLDQLLPTWRKLPEAA